MNKHVLALALLLLANAGVFAAGAAAAASPAQPDEDPAALLARLQIAVAKRKIVIKALAEHEAKAEEKKAACLPLETPELGVRVYETITDLLAAGVTHDVIV